MQSALHDARMDHFSMSTARKLLSIVDKSAKGAKFRALVRCGPAKVIEGTGLEIGPSSHVALRRQKGRYENTDEDGRGTMTEDRDS